MQDALTEVVRRLRDRTNELRFSEPVTHVYNPLDYGWEAHTAYLRRFGSGTGRVVLLGMNPGPFGMAQTAVPFGEIASVRDWMGLPEVTGRPPKTHPKRPIDGFGCSRSEVSGRRLWGWAQGRYGRAEDFFERFFVVNYCPLVFMEGPTGRNRTPDKLPAHEREPLYACCDEALRDTIEILQPSMVVGVGGFAEKRAQQVLGDRVRIGRVLHPSPASPAANRGWQEAAEKQLDALGIG